MHLSGLWACQLLLDRILEASSTLELLNELDWAKAQACYALQKSDTFSYEQVMMCAGFQKEKPTYHLAEIKKTAVQPPIPSYLAEWIEKRKIPISEGYIGIPIKQKGAQQLKDYESDEDPREYYPKELQAKIDRNEFVSFPEGKTDCWIGKHNAPTPRVDIEEYHSTGDMPHFQRLRFQQGSKFTYGGLRLPIEPTFLKDSKNPAMRKKITVKLILDAYAAWIMVQKEYAYLVVLNPGDYANLAEIYEEVYYMDIENRKNG